MNQEFSWLLSNFPKNRLPLPVAYQSIYEKEYKRNRGCHDTSPNLKQRLEHSMHRYVANARSPDGAVLELGAGTLNHVNNEFASRPYDIVEPFTALYTGQPDFPRLRNIYRSIYDIPMEASYAKILSIAVLEHIEDLPCMLATAALLLQDDGVMAHGIPSEGGLLWYMAWRFGTGLSFRLRTGLSYATLMRHEHVNNATEIQRVIRIFFDEVHCTRFPLPFLHGSFYTSVSARIPNKRRAKAFLELAA